jgi:hypothetical protein
MRIRSKVLILILVGALIGRLQTVYSQESQSDRFGPRMKSFLELMQVEENELEYQIQHGEISRREYTRSKNRIAVMRQTAVNIARESGEDRVPELHVVVASEVDQIVDGGAGALKGVKAGTIIEGTWRYIGTVTRGEAFYVFERLLER